MLILPAIDLRQGRCVRLFQGRADMETVYSNDPMAVARSWEAQGAKMLHVVDLDGAFGGSPQNKAVVQAITSVIGIPVQLGGGIRNTETIEEYLAVGVSRVVLGTAAVTDPGLLRQAVTKYGERIVLGLDCKDGKVCVSGWKETAARDGLDFLREAEGIGVRRVVFTDIRRDGTLEGPNFEAIEEVCRHTGLKVIASGGVSSLEDLRRLKELEPIGVEAAIVGKAFYAGSFTLAEALGI
ncbi:MAG: 1-(5-phosphoribosyl)-5-[(5-phosphoribosylamino)methylideneamino]imidazole-4-carboxamide isomerase [Clostridia bacterium]|nr:1-(5-phosphoribosyl)-5-[(5-phosphoribosylamino)methylideneamino]imidazole-4-carboxamide isomerase [Clostridia bacterium]MDQ7791974.1 1-(5-phosphoribosyl)-5-[(5-phosphoribosylamino)methylideneamino]imidazole-4-carboxamide isomerase [Clostridia bacterium]